MDMQIMRRAEALLAVMGTTHCAEPVARHTLEGCAWDVFEAVWRIKQGQGMDEPAGVSHA